MDSIKEIFKIGKGPSSSHTMGPRRAAEIFKKSVGSLNVSSYSVTLYGSLAATGRGHLTDVAIKEILGECNIIWQTDVFLPQHPNGMFFQAFDKDGRLIKSYTTFSIGGGDISDTGKRGSENSIYPHSKMKDILKWCLDNGMTFWEYVEKYEEKDIWDYLAEVWKIMMDEIQRGLDNEGVLPGPLKFARKASSFHTKAKGYQGSMQRRAMTFSYALAAAEENAAGGTIVTAPTCGSCGVLPAVFYLDKLNYDCSDKKIYRGLATAGLIGNLIKTNASISGAEVGCQGEIGSACSMAAGALVQLFGGTPMQIEYGASMGIEHFLGLTCDPVMGLVQIPCIERNAFAATRAIDANVYALMSDGNHRVSFDKVVETMKKTGHDIPSLYKETSEGGLASIFF
ncbi:MAG: L-serine ammonia-lyase [Bacteroidales bacterium]|nr:L-serine ammonia-lyase [Bacteroidales bacterium]